MQSDPGRTADTGEWLRKAKLDLRAAEYGLEAEPPLSADVVFHCQQLAEKALKGFLTWHDEPFRKTHNLVEIGQQCAAMDQTLEDLLRRAGKAHGVCLEVPLPWRARRATSGRSPGGAGSRPGGLRGGSHSPASGGPPVTGRKEVISG